MKMHSAISSVQRGGLPEGRLHSDAESEDWLPLLRHYREAIARLFLTPAHKLSDVEWKRRSLAAKNHEYTGLSVARIEFAIAQDLEFLAAQSDAAGNRAQMKRRQRLRKRKRQRLATHARRLRR
jgi:hypothetical protein